MAQPGRGGRAARILIIDDDASITALFSRTLRLEGHEVWAAQSAEDGLGLARAHSPQAVILDLRKPMTSCLDLLRALREIPGLAQAPVTVVTGDYYLDEDQSAELRSLGAELRFKPMWLDELVALARDMVRVPVSE